MWFDNFLLFNFVSPLSDALRAFLNGGHCQQNTGGKKVHKRKLQNEYNDGLSVWVETLRGNSEMGNSWGGLL